MFLLLLFLDMNNILTFHVSAWWYVLATIEDASGAAIVGRRG